MNLNLDPTTQIFDPSKLTQFHRCPRRYFYRHILGWETEFVNNHLKFGEAFHKALEQLYVGGFSGESVQVGYEQFLEIYRESFLPETDERFSPKTPSSAFVALGQYTERWINDPDFEVLFTEAAGIAPVTLPSPEYPEGRVLHFRVDAIIKDKDGFVQCLEHKTASRLVTSWADQWVLSDQVNAYHHLLYCLYKPEEIRGVLMNLIVFRKNDVAFDRQLIYRPAETMEDWLWNVNYALDMIKFYTESLLTECNPDDSVMNTFPKNPTSCFEYGRLCPYHAFCVIWQNPLAHIESTPIGFKQEFWNPANYEKTATVIEIPISKEVVNGG